MTDAPHMTDGSMRFDLWDSGASERTPTRFEDDSIDPVNEAQLTALIAAQIAALLQLPGRGA
jgi:hypothetical protein